MVKYVPKRGDIIWLAFDPQKGGEIQQTRPAITISPVSYNQKVGLGLFMPITSQIKGYPFEEIIEIKGKLGAILCDQMRSLDWQARKAKFVDQISDEVLEKVMAKFRVLIP
ncbi:MAG: endoribonuclease MazF [Parachlamydia sp.]|jgi:mRNA interferase MazF|nr:endoribonuclease MazF [Parachlamydia sp.]